MDEEEYDLYLEMIDQIEEDERFANEVGGDPNLVRDLYDELGKIGGCYRVTPAPACD